MFFVRHNGGSVWFDHLGQPWPIHGCFANGWRRLKLRDHAVYFSMGLDEPSGDALTRLLEMEPRCRLGLARVVYALGGRLRVLSVDLADGTDRLLVVEQGVAPLKLAGAMVAYRDLDWLASVLVDRTIVSGWWLDDPPGEWVMCTASHLFQAGEVVYHPSDGFGAVLEAGTSGSKVKVLFVDGTTKIFVPTLAKLEWLQRTATYVPIRHLKPTPPAVRPAKQEVTNLEPVIAESVQPGPVTRTCPHCSWRGSKFSRHMKRAHPSVAG